MREDLSGWLEGKALRHTNMELIRDFIQKKIFCRWGIIPVIILDGGPENRGLKKYILDKYKTQVKITLAYHLASNGMIEIGHKLIKDALLKITDSTRKGQVKLLPLILFADRITAKRTTGMTPYKILMGEDIILLIKTKVLTQIILLQELVQNMVDLLAI